MHSCARRRRRHEPNLAPPLHRPAAFPYVQPQGHSPASIPADSELILRGRRQGPVAARHASPQIPVCPPGETHDAAGASRRDEHRLFERVEEVRPGDVAAGTREHGPVGVLHGVHAVVERPVVHGESPRDL